MTASEPPAYLASLLDAGRKLDSPTPGLDRREATGCRIEIRELARLALPTGRVVACAPFLPPLEPFDRSVPPDEYPVFASLARIQPRRAGGGRRIVAALGIRLTPSSPVAWEVARRTDARDEYDVEDATGAFMDASVAGRLARDEAERERSLDALADALDDHASPDWTWGVVPCGTGAGALVASKSGFGDGAYLSWWGLDAKGRPSLLLTDFRVFSAE